MKQELIDNVVKQLEEMFPGGDDPHYLISIDHIEISVESNNRTLNGYMAEGVIHKSGIINFSILRRK